MYQHIIFEISTSHWPLIYLPPIMYMQSDMHKYNEMIMSHTLNQYSVKCHYIAVKLGERISQMW